MEPKSFSKSYSAMQRIDHLSLSEAIHMCTCVFFCLWKRQKNRKHQSLTTEKPPEFNTLKYFFRSLYFSYRFRGFGFVVVGFFVLLFALELQSDKISRCMFSLNILLKVFSPCSYLLFVSLIYPSF